MKQVQDLLAWQKAMDLTVAVYKATAKFPREEMFGLTSQTRRAAGSVPANIAEGHGRYSDVEMRRFCQIAHGSLCELDTHLQIALRLGFLDEASFAPLHALLLDTKRLLVALLRKLETDTRR